MATPRGAAEDAIVVAIGVKEDVEHTVGRAVLPQLGWWLGASEIRLAQQRDQLGPVHAGQGGQLRKRNLHR